MADGAGGRRTITVQLWHWRGETDVYDLEHYQVHEEPGGSRSVQRRTTTYRAWTREHLGELAREAGLVEVHWHPAAPDGYFQPAMTATRP